MIKNTIIFLKLTVVACVVTAIAADHSANEGRYCSPVTSAGEGHWPIDEVTFTKERARKALESLSKHINQVDTQMDFVAIDNDLLQVKGYLLRAYAMDSEIMVQDFCDFIESEAFVQH